MNNSRYELITWIVALFIYLLSAYPVPTIICTIIILIAYFILQNINGNINGGIGVQPYRRNTIASKNYGIHSMESEIRRRENLRSAALYLAPYNNIWGEQKLSNKYCSLNLGRNGYTIIGKELIYPYRHFRIMRTEFYSYEELWDMFLTSFSSYTSYDKLVELCTVFKATYRESVIEETVKKEYQQKSEQVNSKAEMPVLKVPELKEKLDVNNASEVELTSLPGISIVTAKKLIKKREELNGFKNVEDVILFLKLKPHMESQVRELICVKRMKGSDKIKRYNERNIDL